MKVGLVHFCEKFYHLRTDCVKVGLVHFCEKKKNCLLSTDCVQTVRNLSDVTSKFRIVAIFAIVCQQTLFRFLYRIYYMKLSGVNNAPADPTARRGPVGSWWPPDVQNTKICCGFFQTGFRSSSIKQYCGSLLRALAVISPITMTRRGEGGVRLPTGDIRH